MPHVGVIFELRKAETLPGEAVRVAGAEPELGAWDPSWVSKLRIADEDLLRLKTGALRYPNWSMSAPVWFKFEEDQEKVELKEAMDGTDSDNLSTMDSFDSGSSMATTPQARTPKQEVTETAFGIPIGAKTIALEYKFLKDRRQLLGDDVSSFQWESKIENRRVSVPLEPGSMWLVSNERWELDAPASVTRVVQADVLSLCMELDPEYVLGRNKKKSQLSHSAAGRCLGPPTPRGQHRHPLEELEEKEAFAIEEEFEVLSAKQQLPSLLAEKLATQKTASELASEAMTIQHDTELAKAAKERAEEESKALRNEVAELKEAMLALSRRAEASCQEQAGEVRKLREENSGLRRENAELLQKLGELRLELSGAREAPKSAEETAETRQEAAGPKTPVSKLVASRPAQELASPVAAARPRPLGACSDVPRINLAALRRGLNSNSPDSSVATATPESTPVSRETWKRRSWSLSDALFEEADKPLNELLLKTRSSLVAAPTSEKDGGQGAETETELQKVLRRRREKNQC